MGDALGGRNGICSSPPKIISRQVVIKQGKVLWGQQPGYRAALGKEMIVDLSEVL